MAEPSDSTGWQPFESAPKDGTVVLLYSPTLSGDPTDDYSAGVFVSHGPYAEHMGEDGEWMHSLEREPTHWMPLEPPQ